MELSVREAKARFAEAAAAAARSERVIVTKHGRPFIEGRRLIMEALDTITFPERARTIHRAVGRLCLQLGWAALHEVPLPNGRRADLLALRPDGCFACIEVKSGPRDFLTDSKWPEYRDFSDVLYFAVDADFPTGLLGDETGLIIADGLLAEVIRPAPEHRMPPARRRGLLHRFAMLAASRVTLLEDPAGASAFRSALSVE